MTLTEIIPNDRNEFAKIESVNKYLKKAKTPSTYQYWMYNIYDFFKFVKIHPDEFVKLDRVKIEDLIESFVDFLKDRVEKNELNPNSVQTLVVPLKKFLIFNRVEGMAEAWVRIKANFPERKRPVDEKYTEIELQKMYNIADYREKAVLGLLMSGMRIGAIKDIKKCDLKPVEDWAAVKVYTGTNSEYHTFVTPQGYRDILAYFEYRKRNGEIITENSPLIRNDFRPECANEWIDSKGRKRGGGAVNIQSDSGTTGIVIGLVRRAGVSSNSHDHKHRHKTMTCHGFRKYFNTVCKTSGMDSERVELMLGHANSTLEGHYWRLPADETKMSPQDQKLFQTIKTEYRKCIPELTIGESELLKIKNEELQETVNIRLKQKELEIIDLQRQLSKVKENPFIVMSPEKIQKFVEMFEDWNKLQENLSQTMSKSD
jgi:integrase